MNKKECTKRSQQLYGPGASAVNVSSQDRNQRFGIVFYATGGALDSPALGCLGYGDSYDSAWESALKNPVAQAIAKQWDKTKSDFQKFRIDPHGYLDEKKSEILKVAGIENGEQ